MIITFNRFKIVVALNCKMHMGSYRNCCLIFPPHLKWLTVYFIYASSLDMLRTFNVVGYINESELNKSCGVPSICNGVAC